MDEKRREEKESKRLDRQLLIFERKKGRASSLYFGGKIKGGEREIAESQHILVSCHE